MWVKIGRDNAVEISNDVFDSILRLYPEECLFDRPLLREARDVGHISYSVLLGECESICLPWQIFFLNNVNLKKELDSIELQRKDKFKNTSFAKRKGSGDVTSKRIIDRLIRLQAFVESDTRYTSNAFVASFKGRTLIEQVGFISRHFEIDIKKFRSKSKEDALEYLISQITKKNINISRGVLKGGVLPESPTLIDVYKNTSGFVLQSEKVPYVFLPDEINPDDVAGRRIYTLIYLLACIGLDQYDFYIESHHSASMLKRKGGIKNLHDIVTAFLLPFSVTDALRGKIITTTTRDNLANDYKLTPTAVLTTLLRRKIINLSVYNALLPPKYVKKPMPSKPMKRITPVNAANKFCGNISTESINRSLRVKGITNVPAQYLLFGRPRHKDFKSYCKANSL